ncbi:hypothetical protein [Caulobacter rhizosphaerae]|jgi:hypothetical protein|uniref:hypothetical protein n=1 Tax=Caulobacter rhizosphaerae TaxID=2010972 RepID=UPI0013D613F1|nr:hypothetical protein [Caulobacter rhizosphaerae]GGL29988.1 hypothetical protein GCM10010983_29120 [Caulobacter rhizosphaerae]
MDMTRRGVATGLAAASAFPGLAAAQASPAPAEASPQTRLFLERRYLPVWRAIQAAPQDPGLQQMASFLGDEATALASAGLGPAGDPPLPADATAQDALAAIVEAARDRRVVVLNEAHVASRHRGFLARVLRALRPLGFDVLAAEDFLNSREPGAPTVRSYRAGAALDPSLGFYLHDPVYAEAVREAAGLGYRLASYEQREDQCVSGEDKLAAMARRETAEADNFIADVLAPNPSSRVLVHCGYSHLRKTPDHRGTTWFAARLKEKSGIDPLCVSQAYTGSFEPHGADPPMTTAVLERFRPVDSIVVRGADGWLGAEPAGADLAVFHPPLADVAGRPGWLAADHERRRVEVAAPRPRTATVLLQAVHAVDSDQAIPADQLVLAPEAASAVLFLRPGAYRLRLETETGLVPLRTLTV